MNLLVFFLALDTVVTPSTPDCTGWVEVSIDVHPVAHEALSAFLFDLGCKGVVTKDFNDHTFKAYLPFQKNLEDIQNRLRLFLQVLKKIFPEVKSQKPIFSKMEDQDWSRNWRRFFRPDRVTQRLTVLPAWEPMIPCEDDAQVIRIDPGPAFGTGQHPTTRMCLEAMEKIPLPGSWTMLDVGTGSGILAIYGAKLGAGRVSAIDLDPEAIRWAERNIELNDISIGIDLSSRPLEKCEETFTLITANLILNTILDLFPHFPRVLYPDGWLILSGILRNQVKEVEGGFAEYGCYTDQALYQDDWACLIARKRIKG